MQAVPEYAEMQTSMEQLRGQYEAEQKRVEDDFNKKYEDFLDGQASFPKTILQKRQSELQEMLDKNIAFKKEGQKLLCKAHCEAKAPLVQKLNEVLAKIGQERGYAFILNTDGNATPWLNPAMGEDITNDVKTLLQTK
jgi:outer membrane protein